MSRRPEVSSEAWRLIRHIAMPCLWRAYRRGPCGSSPNTSIRSSVLRREKVGDTIVMFGSARILSREQALARLEKVRKAGNAAARPSAAPPCATAKASLEMSRYYEEARELARRITSWAMSLATIRAGSSSAPGAGRESWRRPISAPPRPVESPSALSIQLPHEQRPNDTSARN